jgi:hypothetical protein
MRCLGTSQHLKDTHGSGYILEVKLKPASLKCDEETEDPTEKLHMFVGEIFQGGRPVAENDLVEIKQNFGEFFLAAEAIGVWLVVKNL